jgi:hypothetical protein
MRLKPDEKIIRIDDINPEALKQLEPVWADFEENKKEIARVASQLEMLKAKGEYLTKLKWTIFDKFHPETDQANHKCAPNMNASRRYDREEKKVALVEFPLGGGLPDFIRDALFEALDVRSPNKPKEPAPAAAETASAG